jgi:hypothetical protein
MTPQLACGSRRGQNLTHCNVTAIALESAAKISLTET